MVDGTARTESFTVTVNDGDALGPFPAGTLAQPRYAELDGDGAGVAGRLVRIDIDNSTGGNVGAVEVRIFPVTP